MVIPQSTRGTKRFYWDIVCNNYTLEECEFVKVTFDNIADAYIIGKEVGSGGTPHLQMMVKLKKGNYKSFLIKKLGNRFSIREGRNINAMKEYCQKDGDIYAKLNVERIQASKNLDEKIDEQFGFRSINRRKLYDKFILETDPNLEGYDWLKSYLLNRVNGGNYTKRIGDYLNIEEECDELDHSEEF